MKKSQLFSLIIIGFLFVSVFNSCKDDDDDPFVVPENVITTTDRINTNTKELQAFISAKENNEKITGIIKNGNDLEFTFASGNKATFYQGKANSNLPLLSAKEYNGVYYWILLIGNEERWVENNGNKIPVASSSNAPTATTPVIGVDNRGLWTVTVDGKTNIITNSSGQPIPVKTDENLSPFVNYDLSNEDVVVITVLPDTKLTLLREDVMLSIQWPTDSIPVLFDYAGQTVVKMKLKNMVSIEDANGLIGWTVTVNMSDSTLKITAPQADNDAALTDGRIKVKGLDKNGFEYFAEYPVYTVDYTHPGGTFFVIEGNMTTENGTVVYIDQYMREHTDVYENSNGGAELGNVVQDMYINNGKIYFLSQNGNSMGGADRFVICNGRTLKKEYSHPMAFNSDGGVPVWPQHLVVANNKAFIQYSTSDMELSSGIRVFDLNSKILATKDIEGTYGTFTKEGALKGRMLISKGKIYAGLGEGIVIIDPATDKVDKTINYGQQVKGLVKGADGNIHIAIAGKFTGSVYAPIFTSKPKIVGIDHDGKQVYESELDGVNLPVAPWSPWINMSASFKDDYLYFVATDAFSATELARFNYKTKEFKKDFISAPATIYGMTGIHPVNGFLFMGMSPFYISSQINLYDIAEPTKVLHEYNYKKASPAGVDFGYRFTKEFIDK